MTSVNREWVTRNIVDNLEGRVLDSSDMEYVGTFFMNFYTEIVNDSNQLEIVQNTNVDKSKRQVFDLLKTSNPKTEEDLVNLQREIEKITIAFNEGDIFERAPEIVDRLIGKNNQIDAKEYLRSINLLSLLASPLLF